MQVDKINTFIVSLEKILAEKVSLAVTRLAMSPYKPMMNDEFDVMVIIPVTSVGIDRIVYYFPERTARELAKDMFFGLEVTDEELINSAISELFYRITTNVSKLDPSIIINDAPVTRKAEIMKDEESLYGITIDFSTPPGAFRMCVLNR
jgi:CheY-specific phosphatase CheX